MTTDIAETIALLRTLYVSGRAGDVDDICRMEREIWKVLPALLDAAESAATARDAALEEAAAYSAGFDAGLEVAACLAENAHQQTLATAIRALRSKP